MEDSLVRDFTQNLNANIQHLLDNHSLEFNISNLDSNSENTSKSFEDLISLLINTNTGEWLEKHLLEHYYEFVQRFSKSSFDKKLLLLLSFSDNQNRDYNSMIFNTVQHFLDNIKNFLNKFEKENEDKKSKKLFHLSFCYFLRIIVCKLRNDQLITLTEKIIQVLMQDCGFTASEFSYESAEVIGDIIKSEILFNI